LVAFVTVGQVGELLQLPAWVIDLSPFTEVPRMPVEDFAWTPELLLALVAAVLLAGSWVRYRWRDIG
jgi:polyether ionophore transport system permease protein